MNKEKNQSGLTFPKMLFKGSFIFNPVLTQAIGICTIIAIAVNLKISLVLSAMLTIIIIVNECLASLVLKKLSRWLRVIIYMVISILILTPASFFLDQNYSELYASMGIYLPLLSANSLIVIRCEKYGVKNSLKYSFFDAVCAGAGFSGAAIIIGSIREIVAFGTIFGKQISSLPTFSAMAAPFGGLIVTGFLAAFHKWLVRKKFRGQPTNTFNIRPSMDRPVLKDEGIHVTQGSFSLFRDPEIPEKIQADEAGEESESGYPAESHLTKAEPEKMENSEENVLYDTEFADTEEELPETINPYPYEKEDANEAADYSESAGDEADDGDEAQEVLIPIEADGEETEGDEV